MIIVFLLNLYLLNNILMSNSNNYTNFMLVLGVTKLPTIFFSIIFAMLLEKKMYVYLKRFVFNSALSLQI